MAFYVIDGRRGGKGLACARAAVKRSTETGLPVAVTCEFTKARILEVADRMGVKIPEPVVVKPGVKPEKGVTLAGVIVDYQF